MEYQIEQEAGMEMNDQTEQESGMEQEEGEAPIDDERRGSLHPTPQSLGPPGLFSGVNC
jgi:hypothetical protein